MSNWKRKTNGLILRNIIYLLYGEPFTHSEEHIFQDCTEKKAYEHTTKRINFLEEHFAGYFTPPRSSIDSYTVTDLIGGRTGKAAKGASAGVRNGFVDLLSRTPPDEDGKTPLDYLISKNCSILSHHVYDMADFYEKVSRFMENARHSRETQIPEHDLNVLYDSVRFYLDLKTEEGYATALTWLLIAALLQNKLTAMLLYCQISSAENQDSVLSDEKKPYPGRKASEAAPYSLSERFPQIRDIFDGRENCIRQISDFFADGKRTLFLNGIGGIGKSELAKQYALQHRKNYDTIVFIPYQSSLIDIVCNSEPIYIKNLRQKAEETKEQFFQRKLSLLKHITDEKTLIILDNFNVNRDEKLDEFLNGNYHVIVTTRNEYPGYYTLTVKEIADEKALLRIFEKNYGSPVTDLREQLYIKKIIQLIWRHTYTVELTAKQMAASFLSAREMYELLKKDSIRRLPPETVEGKYEWKSAFDHICRLFDLSRLDEKQRQVMRCLSLMGICGVPADNFRKWLHLESYETINQLIRQSWIRREAGRKIALHPLVIQVVWATDPPSLPGCSDFLEQVDAFCMRGWWQTAQENLAVTDNILALLDYFQNKSGRLPFRLWRCFNFLWQVGQFDASIRYGHLFYESSVKQFGENSLEAGLIASKLGGSYFNAARRQEAFLWYQKGLQSMLAGNAPEHEDLALAYEKAGRSYTWPYQQDFGLARKYLYRALDIRQKLLKDIQQGADTGSCYEYSGRSYGLTEAQGGLASVYLELGRMYQCMGDYQKALDYARRHIELLKFCGLKRTAGVAHGYFDVGISCYHLGWEKKNAGQESEAVFWWEQAEQYLQTALELNLSRRGFLAIDCMYNEKYLADTFWALGKTQRAQAAYQTTLQMAEKLLGTDSEQYRQIRESVRV